MKTIKFREVLWTVANKLGLDPEQGNFMSNQAIPLGRYIDEWVRRTYDSQDWNELVVTRMFEPSSAHVVPYQGVDDVYGFEQAFRLGRVLKVYLVDPRATSSPVSTEYTMGMSGVHVGYDHGTTVWMRYMFPPPRYTCEVWSPNFTYSKDQVVYDPSSGECYRSRVNWNRNNDPSHSFQLPPFPPDEEPPGPIESGTPPLVAVAQNYIANDPGVVGQTQKVEIDPFRVSPVPAPPDPTLNGTFVIEVSNAADTVIGSAVHVATGQSWITIIADLAAQLDASLPGSFIVTSSPVSYRIDLEDLSAFKITQYSYTPGLVGGAGNKRYMRVVQHQVYVAPRPAVEGQPQVTGIRITNESLIPGGLYRITVTDGTGTPHPVEYQSVGTDGIAQITQGLVDAMANTTDVYWEGIFVQVSAPDGAIVLTINDNASTNAVILLVGDPYWEWNLFPQVIAEQVIRGALSDLYKEWGQNDKAAAEEAAVPAETQLTAGKAARTADPPLSGQQAPASRYKV